MGDAVAHFPREVQALTIVLQHVDDPQALLVVIEAAWYQFVQHALAGVAERRVAQIVAQRDGFGELLVELQHLGDRPGDLRYLQRVGETSAIVITRGSEEHLCLVLQPPERFAVHDAVPIVLERRTHIVLGLLTLPAARFGALGRLRRQICRSRASRCLRMLAMDVAQKARAVLHRPYVEVLRDVCPRSAKVRRVPRSTLFTRLPAASSGTCSRE
jgi:hypothetical protein